MGLVFVNSALNVQLAQMISIGIIVMDQNAQSSYGQNNIGDNRFSIKLCFGRFELVLQL